MVANAVVAAFAAHQMAQSAQNMPPTPGRPSAGSFLVTVAGTNTPTITELAGYGAARGA